MLSYFYKNDISDFVAQSPEEVLGVLADKNPFDLTPKQRTAWREQVTILQNQLKIFAHGQIYFELTIPRIGKRIDVVVLLNNVIIILEFKVGAATYNSADMIQALDYALDLKNFHQGSHNRRIAPILVSTNAKSTQGKPRWGQNGIASVLTTSGSNLAEVLLSLAPTPIQAQSLSASFQFQDPGPEYAQQEWDQTGYHPSPSIIEAARALYQGHSVEEISRSDAGATNLTETTQAVENIIRTTRSENQKSIIFVTGVPGAGKTLVGLNLATKPSEASNGENAVFLSGNGPLVAVLREALTRDAVATSKLMGSPSTKSEAGRKVESFIQNVHHFRNDYANTTIAPPEHIVVFDEAQRAWDKAQSTKFMQSRGFDDFDQSEPAFLLGVMDRKPDWCVVVCLVGEGQEINKGEAGISAWLNAVRTEFPHWNAYASDQIDHDTNASEITINKSLHLTNSMRSFRSTAVATWVNHVISGNPYAANEILDSISNYPIVLSRSKQTAINWTREQAQGSERTGLIASSSGGRLKAEGIFIKNTIEPAIWFLNDSTDVRSSYYMEDVASEFDIQGLELDWVIVGWDADLRWNGTTWDHKNFIGTRWQNVNKTENKQYLENAYRVLLSRARQGLCIFVPKGDPTDETRLPEFYDPIANYLYDCGIKALA